MGCHTEGHTRTKCPKNKVEIKCITTNDGVKYYKEIKVDNVPVKGFIDTGSLVSVIRESVAPRIIDKFESSDLLLVGYGKHEPDIVGKFQAEVQIDTAVVDSLTIFFLQTEELNLTNFVELFAVRSMNANCVIKSLENCFKYMDYLVK